MPQRFSIEIPSINPTTLADAKQLLTDPSESQQVQSVCRELLRLEPLLRQSVQAVNDLQQELQRRR